MKRIISTVLATALLSGCISTGLEPGVTAYLYTWNDRENPVAAFETLDGANYPPVARDLMHGALLGGKLLLDNPDLDTRSAVPYLLEICQGDSCRYSVLFPSFFKQNRQGKVGGYATINELTTAFYHEVKNRPMGEVKFYLDQMASQVVNGEVEGFEDDAVDYHDIATLDFAGFYSDRFSENLYDTTLVERAVAAFSAGYEPSVSVLLAGGDGSETDQQGGDETPPPGEGDSSSDTPPPEDSDTPPTEDGGSGSDAPPPQDSDSDAPPPQDGGGSQDSLVVEGCVKVLGFSSSYAACPGGSTFDLSDCTEARDGSLTCEAGSGDQPPQDGGDQGGAEEVCTVVEYPDNPNFDGGTGYGYLCPNGVTYHPYQCQFVSEDDITCDGYSVDASNCNVVNGSGPAFCFTDPDSPNRAEHCVVGHSTGASSGGISAGFGNSLLAYFCPDGQEYGYADCDAQSSFISCGGYPIASWATAGQHSIDCVGLEAWNNDVYTCRNGLAYHPEECSAAGDGTYECTGN